MGNGHIRSVRHLRVFGSTFYALILKEKRNKLGARSQKYIFLRYSNTIKAYHLHIKVKTKIIFSIDVGFLESSKNDKIVERQLDHLDKFTYVKTYQ
jgi:hypothetical protein